MIDAVAIIGVGALADYVNITLSDSYNIIRRKDYQSGVPKSAKLSLVVNDEYRPSDYSAAEKAQQEAAKPWLSAFMMGDVGVVGPLVVPGTPGCSQCALMRRFAAGSDREEILKVQADLFRHGVIKRERFVAYAGLLQMTRLILSETQKILQGNSLCSDGRIYSLDLKTLNTARHPFLPDPLCPVCGQLPEDSAEGARIALRPNPKSKTDTYRCRSMDELEDVLVNDYWDERTGILHGINADAWSPFCDILVCLPSLTGMEWTAGRSHSYHESKQTAILEGLERYCGMMPRGKRTNVFDSYCNVKDQALDPLSVGLYSEEQYALPDFPFEPFDANAAMHWVWGYSFLQQRPILIPQELAYYSSGFGNSLIAEGSNGSALGGSLEEAILHGILEVVERDSFLMTWYARLPVPRVDPYSADDKELLLMIHRLQAVAGYDLYLFNTTMENGIPSLWAIAKNNKDTGANLICAAGAHLDPVRAAKSAIHELAGAAGYLDHMFHANQEEYVGMINDPYLVTEMGDHAYLYTVPQAEERLHFLLQSPHLQTFQQAFLKRSLHVDLTEDLQELLTKFRRLNMDVIVVDQSTPETTRNRLHCIKAIIPGMLPMTFGHHLRRVTGLDRLKSVPMQLGFKEHVLTEQDLNPHPHPFL